MSSHPLSTGWIETPAGRRALQRRIPQAEAALLKDDLSGEFRKDARGAKPDPAATRKRDQTARRVLEEMKFLALARLGGIPVSQAAWARAAAVLDAFLEWDVLASQGSLVTPPWRADLSTADLGVGLALLASIDSPMIANRKKTLAEFLRKKCWQPAAAEWLSHGSRLHSLDTMGHNWWAVIAGGAGVVAALLGWDAEARRAADAVAVWFRYPGNPTMRKQPNFGPEGDFLEGFSYGDYGLIHPLALAHLLGGDRPVPAWLDEAQCQGLAAWYRHAFVETASGWWPVRFGDIGLNYRPRPSVWHSLAHHAGDRELLRMAHRISPEPTLALDFLLWRESIPGAAAPRRERRVFSTSGCAFLGGGDLQVAVRAGEFWNHNHLDAGTFLFAQNGVVWIDDAGTCRYGSPEYIRHYASPASHNVTCAPRLAPPIAEAKELGLDLKGEVLAHERGTGCEFLHLDTRVLSAGSMLRSRRSFFVLAGELLVIWDDLEARRPEKFRMQLHTVQAVRSESDHRIRLSSGSRRHCVVLGFSDGNTAFSTRPVKMGDLPEDFRAGPRRGGALAGTSLRWNTRGPALRRKFLVALGTAVRGGEWREDDSGWECRIDTVHSRWTLWFNRLADGRIAHQNSTARWQNFETDAYAMVLQETGGRQILFACQASFVRRGAKVLHGSPRRTVLKRLIVPRSQAN